MGSYKEMGFLFIQSYELDEDEIKEHLQEKIDKTIGDINYDMYINVVKKRDNSKLGYSYIWVDNEKIYNLFCSRNLDGSERVEMKEDPKWKKKVTSRSLLGSGSDALSWGDLAEEEECPMIKTFIGPLTDIEYYVKGDYQMRIGPAKVDHIGSNSIYTKNIDNWITEKLLHDFFSRFEKDKQTHVRKGKNFTYPKIEIKGKNNKRNATIEFSKLNLRTASFLINVVKKINITDGNRSKMLFFSLSKQNTY